MEHGIRRISNALCASASAAALVVCCVSCAHSTTEDVGYLEGFTTSGAFLVVRLSSQGIRNGLPPDTANGYLVAFQQDGSMSAAWTQGLLSSEMTWNGPVLSVGDSAYEYLITDDGASAFPRTVDGGHEVGRFVSSTDGSVLSFYVEGPVQRAYNIDSGGIRDRSENQEFYLTNGECGGEGALVHVHEDHSHPSGKRIRVRRLPPAERSGVGRRAIGLRGVGSARRLRHTRSGLPPRWGPAPGARGGSQGNTDRSVPHGSVVCGRCLLPPHVFGLT